MGSGDSPHVVMGSGDSPHVVLRALNDVAEAGINAEEPLRGGANREPAEAREACADQAW